MHWDLMNLDAAARRKMLQQNPHAAGNFNLRKWRHKDSSLVSVWLERSAVAGEEREYLMPNECLVVEKALRVRGNVPDQNGDTQSRFE